MRIEEGQGPRGIASIGFTDARFTLTKTFNLSAGKNDPSLDSFIDKEVVPSTPILSDWASTGPSRHDRLQPFCASRRVLLI
jgi:hypothetical protein